MDLRPSPLRLVKVAAEHPHLAAGINYNKLLLWSLPRSPRDGAARRDGSAPSISTGKRAGLVSTTPTTTGGCRPRNRESCVPILGSHWLDLRPLHHGTGDRSVARTTRRSIRHGSPKAGRPSQTSCCRTRNSHSDSDRRLRYADAALLSAARRAVSGSRRSCRAESIGSVSRSPAETTLALE